MKREIAIHLITAVVFTLFGIFLSKVFIGFLKRKLNLLDDISLKIDQISDSLRMFNDSMMKEFSSLHEDIALLPTRAELTGLLPHVDNFAQSYVFFFIDAEDRTGFGEGVNEVKMTPQSGKSERRERLLDTNLGFCDREPNLFPQTSKYYFYEHLNFTEENCANSSSNFS
jgi:hypothetical protein